MNKNNKLIKIFVIALGAVLLTAGCTLAGNSAGGPNSGKNGESTAKATVYFFYGEGCPHCAAQKSFLEEIEGKYPGLEIKRYETWQNRDNVALFQNMALAYGIEARGVPTTFIGDFSPFVGFSEAAKGDMEDKIKLCLEQGCIDPGSKL